MTLDIVNLRCTKMQAGPRGGQGVAKQLAWINMESSIRQEAKTSIVDGSSSRFIAHHRVVQAPDELCQGLVLSRCPLASVVELDQDTGSGGQESLMISIPWQTTPVSRARSPNCSTSDKLGDERKNIVSSRPHRPSQKKDTVICSERRVQSGPPVAIFFISITLRRLPFASGSAPPCCATGGCSRNKPMSTTCGQPPGEYRHCLETT